MRAGPATAWDVAAAACGILADGFAAENLAASVIVYTQCAGCANALGADRILFRELTS
jgi:3'-phosphoadenosine 5'-phosphosulfate (PAPS) 3'-phosphatase